MKNGPMKHDKEIGLLLYTHYHTFQGIYDVYSKSLSVHNVFKKLVIHCMDWIKERIGEDKINQHKELQEFNQFPKVEDYEKFDLHKHKDFRIIDILEVRSLYIEEEKGWTFRITEPGNGDESDKYPNRVYITNLSAYEEEDSVKFSVRVTCKEPETNEDVSDVPLPQIIRRLFLDEELLLKESKLSNKYEFSEKPIIINGSQKADCADFVDNFYFNKYRQMPILLCPVKEYEEAPEFIELINQELVGACHVVVAEKGYTKLFSTNFGKDQEVIDNLQYARNYVFLHGSNSLDQDDNKTIIKMKWMPPEQEETLDDDKRKQLADSARKVILDKIIDEAMKAQRLKHYDYQGYKFYKELRRADNEKKIRTGSTDLVSEAIDSFKNQVAMLEADKSEVTRTAYNYKHDLFKKEAAYNALEEHFNQLTERCEALEKELEGAKIKNEDLREENRCLQAKYEGRTPVVKKSETVELNDYKTAEIWKPMAHIPMSNGKVDKNGIIDWIRTFFSDTIELHDNAIAAYKDDKRDNLDYYAICLMINQIAGYVRVHNQGGVDLLDYSLPTEYYINGKNYPIKPSSTGESNYTQFRDYYHITYKNSAGKDKTVRLDLHIGSGGGMDASCIRIYFHYDSEAKKAYVGSLPKHLPTRENPT